MLLTETNLKAEIPEIPIKATTVKPGDLPFIEVGTTILSVSLAVATLIRAKAEKQSAIREAEKQLINNLRREIEEKDDELESLKRKVTRLENRLKQEFDGPISGPISAPLQMQGYNNGFVPQGNPIHH